MKKAHIRDGAALTKFIYDSDPSNWNQLSMTMDKQKAIEYINNNKGFCYMTTFAGRIKLEALSVVCESSYSGWYNAFNLAYDPKPLLEAKKKWRVRRVRRAKKPPLAKACSAAASSP